MSISLGNETFSDLLSTEEEVSSITRIGETVLLGMVLQIIHRIFIALVASMSDLSSIEGELSPIIRNGGEYHKCEKRNTKCKIKSSIDLDPECETFFVLCFTDEEMYPITKFDEEGSEMYSLSISQGDGAFSTEEGVSLSFFIVLL